MKLNAFEAGGVALSLGIMVLALWLVRLETTGTQLASVSNDNQPALITGTTETAQADAQIIADSYNEQGELARLIVDDVVIGTGPEAVEGDTVTVHYVGRLENGQEFDNSYNKARPFTFTLGEGRVIEGWEAGVAGMQVGGERILVIPPDLGYGEKGAGPVPGDATLLFVVELLEIE